MIYRDWFFVFLVLEHKSLKYEPRLVAVFCGATYCCTSNFLWLLILTESKFVWLCICMLVKLVPGTESLVKLILKRYTQLCS